MAVDTSMLALHGLAVKKSGPPEEVARITGLPVDAVASEFQRAQDADEVLGAKGTFMLTPAGQAKLAAGYATVCADIRENSRFQKAYEHFESVNGDLLDLFTRWQTVTRAGATVPNDHTDPEYDAKLVDELGDIHERAERTLSDFTEAVPRFSIYRDRLAAAYDKVLGGEQDYVSGVRLDSYHTVWFEMHEDLLRLLGRERDDARG
jgi:hypothetical protein